MPPMHSCCGFCLSGWKQKVRSKKAKIQSHLDCLFIQMWLLSEVQACVLASGCWEMCQSQGLQAAQVAAMWTNRLFGFYPPLLSWEGRKELRMTLGTLHSICYRSFYAFLLRRAFIRFLENFWLKDWYSLLAAMCHQGSYGRYNPKGSVVTQTSHNTKFCIYCVSCFHYGLVTKVECVLTCRKRWLTVLKWDYSSSTVRTVIFFSRVFH